MSMRFHPGLSDGVEQASIESLSAQTNGVQPPKGQRRKEPEQDVWSRALFRAEHEAGTDEGDGPALHRERVLREPGHDGLDHLKVLDRGVLHAE